MWLDILQTCKHERDAFVAGEIRWVDDATAGVLTAHGWAKPTDEPPPAWISAAGHSVTLQIHPGTLGVADTLKGI